MPLTVWFKNSAENKPAGIATKVRINHIKLFFKDV